MDGNNRWSKKNSQSKIKSYSKGAQKLLTISKKIFDNYNVEYISAFALSNNNLNRTKSLIDILKKILLNFLNDEQSILKLNFQIIFLGDLKFVGKDLIKKIKEIQNINRSKKQKLIIFLNYSGRKDINLFYAKKIKNFLENYNIFSNTVSANFLMLDFEKSKYSANFLYKRLKKKGIILRSTEEGYHIKNKLRLTIGSSKENLKFMNVVRRILN